MKKGFLKNIHIIATILLLGAYCLHSTSCANTKGAPSGGPKDTIPPVVVKMVPDSNAVNFPRTKGQIVITFNEYVQIKDPSNNVFLSPPQGKRPKTKIKGKSIVVTFEEPLDSATTYTLNFGNAIQDNNENNPLPYFTYTFSTGNTIDSMLFTGSVYDYSTLLPVEGVNVGLYTDATDSTVFNALPNAVTRTDKWGYFVFRNIPKKPYTLYAFKDENKNNKYESGIEQVGFLDSLVTPSIVMAQGLTQIAKYDMKDTLLCLERPSEVNVMLFSEVPTKQYIRDYKRVSEREAYIKFGAPNVQIDSFSIRGIRNARVIEQFNETKDSLNIWIKDGKSVDDTLYLGIKYLKTDSLNNLTPTVENLKFILTKAFKVKEEERLKKQREQSKGKEKIREDLLSFNTASQPDKLDQDGITLTFPQPLVEIQKDSILFTLINPRQQRFAAEYTFEQDTADIKKYIIRPVEEFKTGNDYEIIFKKNTFKDILGHTNDSTYLKASLPTDDKLSSLTVTFKNVDARYIVELTNETRNNVFRRYVITESKSVLFPYLKAGKYSIRITEDLNCNGRLDIGDVLLKKQPEKVILYTLPSGSEIFDIKERMDIEQEINIKDLFRK